MTKENNIKVAILTYSHIRNMNFGALLQCFALYNVIKKTGNKPIVIDWSIKSNLNVSKFKSINKEYTKLNTISTLKRKLGGYRYAVNAHVSFFLSRQKILDFHSNYFKNKTAKVSKTNISELNNLADAFIVGSDQVWRYKYCPDIEMFFLNFVNKDRKKRSYAASFGIDKWNEAPENVTQCVRELIHRFDHVSVREKSGVQICEKVFNKDACRVLDPTLLLTAKEYVDICKLDLEKAPEMEYVGAMFLEPEKNILLMKKIKRIMGKKVINLKGINYNILSFNFLKIRSVTSWVNHIRYADFIVTDSFHCTAFCIIFNKPFVVIANKKRGISRLENLLYELGLINHLFTNENMLFQSKIWENDINYSYVNKKLKLQQETSNRFLLNALTNNTE